LTVWRKYENWKRNMGNN